MKNTPHMFLFGSLNISDFIKILIMENIARSYFIKIEMKNPVQSYFSSDLYQHFIFSQRSLFYQVYKKIF